MTTTAGPGIPDFPPPAALDLLPVRPFRYNTAGELTLDDLPLTHLAARFGTPLYLYSNLQIQSRLALFDKAFASVPHLVCYAVKANSALAILQGLGSAGAGFDIVSGGELERVRRASPAALPRVVFSGVGKQAWEIDAALGANILLFNAESPAEIELLAVRAAALGVRAPLALRVNPDVFAETHPYISTGLREHKFGIPLAEARQLYGAAARHKSLQIKGVSVHIGSQIRSVAPFAEALARVAALVGELRSDGHTITHIDAGGGLGIDYTAQVANSAKWHVNSSLTSFAGARVEHRTPSAEEVPANTEHPEGDDVPASPASRVEQYARALLPVVEPLGCTLVLEPGRFLVAPAGGLLTRVLSEKRNGAKRFVITDAAMNDLIRPALYGAHHEIFPVNAALSDRAQYAWNDGAIGKSESAVVLARGSLADVVGPVCESGDFLAQDRALPQTRAGDLLLIADAGAYGMSQSSNYNSRPRPAEVLVIDGEAHLIRRRETMEDLLAPEHML